MIRWRRGVWFSWFFTTSNSWWSIQKEVPVRPNWAKSRYRQIVEPPCRVSYRYDGTRVFVLHVMRGEMRLRRTRLIKRDQDAIL